MAAVFMSAARLGSSRWTSSWHIQHRIQPACRQAAEPLRARVLDICFGQPLGHRPESYAPFAQRIFAAFTQPTEVTFEADVAEAVWRAANDTSGQLRFPAGADAVALAQSQ
jgi:hypothetical protein